MDSLRAGNAASAANEPVVMIRTTQNAKESADPSKGNGIFTIQRTGPTSAPLEVHYTVDTSAANAATPGPVYAPGVDYLELSGVATIPAHKSSVQVRVQAYLDPLPEGRETVIVDLTSGPYAVDDSNSSASLGITNVFAIDTTTAFGDSPSTYTSTSHITYKGNPKPKIITTADATFPLGLLGFGAAAPVGSDFLIMNGTQGSSGVFLDNMQLKQKESDSPENYLILRTAQTRGAADKGGVEQSALFIPPIVGPSSTLKLYSQLSVNGSSDTVPGTVQITTKATANVKVSTPAGTFTATKLLVSTIISGNGHVEATVRYTHNGSDVIRGIHASVNDQITWTYYLVPGMGAVKAVVTASFNETTLFPLTFNSTYALPQPAPAPALDLSPSVLVTA